jgi:sulfate transport system permease protein
MIVERARPPKGRSAVREPEWVRKSLLAVAILFLGIFVLVPLLTVFEEAFKKGLGVYLGSFNDSAALSAIKLTLLVAAIAVPANLVFGVSAAWAISKFDFPGKSLLITLIDLPFAVSPVVAGLIYVLIFGSQGWLGPFLQEHNIKIIFAVPGIVLATIFVTFPVYCPGTDSADASARQRRRTSGPLSGRQRLANPLASNAAQRSLGSRLWGDSL